MARGSSWVSRGVLALSVTMAATAAAQPCDQAAAAATVTRIRAHLANEARRARTWNIAWAIGYGVAAGAQVGMALAELTPIGEFDRAAEANLYIGAGQAAIGALAPLVLPLRIVQPGVPTGDACADLADATRALRESAHNEKEGFYLNHIGGLALPVGGALLLGFYFDSWEEAAISFGLGYPVSLATTYTQPRRSWRAVRSGELTVAAPAASWRLTPVHGRVYSGLVISGEF